MFRPDGLLEWNKKTHDIIENLGILPPQVEFPIVVPDSFYWGMLRRQIFEAGADEMLNALRNLRHDDIELDSERIEKGDTAEGTYPENRFPYAVTQVFIPDD